MVLIASGASNVFAQRLEGFGYFNTQGVVTLKTNFTEFIDYYNKVNNTEIASPKFGYGYKMGAGIIMMDFVFGMSQHQHFLSTSGKKKPLANGYREFDISHRSRNAIMGYASKGEEKCYMINLEMGIARNIINTGFVYKDGFKSYGGESGINGSYAASSFHIGLEYVWQKQIKNKLNIKIGGSVHSSNKLKFTKYEDEMEYKRTTNNYVLYTKQTNNAITDYDAYLNASYTYVSLLLGLQYQIK